MAYRIMTQDLYDSLVLAYREKPGNHSNAGRVAGCDRRMAKRAWETGWERLPWAKPIQAVLRDEQVQARAAIHRDRRDEYMREEKLRAEAAAEAAEARAQEGKLVKTSRGSALALLGQTVRALRAAQPFIRSLEQAGATASDMPPEQALRILDRISRMTANAIQVSKDVMKLERMHLGEPDEVIGVKLQGVETGDLLGELRAIESVLKRAETRQIDNIVDAEVIR